MEYDRTADIYLFIITLLQQCVSFIRLLVIIIIIFLINVICPSLDFS